MHLPWRDVALPGGPAIPTSVTGAETVRLRELARGADVLEIGAAYGYSTVVLAQVARAVTSIDPHVTHRSYETLRTNLAAYGIVPSDVEILREPSLTALPKLVNRRYDLIFIDGDHTAAGVRFDLEYALKLLTPGGAVALHDVGETCCCPEVGPTVDSMIQGYEMVDTMAVYRP